MGRTQNIESGIRRAQLFVRDCGEASRDWRSDHTASSGNAYAMIGVAEIDDKARWKRDAVHDFGSMITSFGGIMSFEGAPRPLEPHTASCDLSSASLEYEFRNAGDIHRALGYSGGGMILRDTRMPSVAGTSIVAVMMCVCLPKGTLPDAHMLSMTVESRAGEPTRPGTGRLEVAGPCSIETRGMSLCQVHKSPLWGWGPEPRGFASLMRLDMVDMASRLQELMVDDDADPDEIARLRRITGHAVQDNKDRMYASFRRSMAKDGLLRPWDETPTASEVQTRGQNVARLVEVLLDDFEGPRYAA